MKIKPLGHAKRALIFGCGYLGAFLVSKLVHEQVSVIATTKSKSRWAALVERGAQPLGFDIEQYSSDFEQHLESDELDVFFMLTPSAIAPALAPGAGFDRLLEKLTVSNLQRAVLVSSTSVYGDARGQRVDAATPIAPNNARSERVAEIERRWRSNGGRFSVCRLAGLYGPNRIVGRQQLNDGSALSGSAGSWLNLIHVADAADLLFACTRSPHTQPIELGSDGCPVMRGDYYTYLADILSLGAPRFTEGGSGRSGSKRCDPSATMQRLDWSPRYADFRAGLHHSLGV